MKNLTLYMYYESKNINIIPKDRFLIIINKVNCMNKI